jgi:hypothetical protein
MTKRMSLAMQLVAAGEIFAKNSTQTASIHFTPLRRGLAFINISLHWEQASADLGTMAVLDIPNIWKTPFDTGIETQVDFNGQHSGPGVISEEDLSGVTFRVWSYGVSVAATCFVFSV